MKHLVIVAINMIIAAIICNAQQVYRLLPAPPGKYEIRFVSLLESPASLDQLIRLSDLIIDGKLKEMLPAIHLNPENIKNIETHSRVSINSVIQGKLPEGQKIVAISEPGGKSSDGYEVVYRNYSHVKSDQRYILFLKIYPGEKGHINDMGMPLYYIVGWTGKAQVADGEKIQFPPAAAPELHSFDGMNVEKFITVIKERINYLSHPFEFPPGLPEPYPPDAPRFPYEKPNTYR